MTTTRQRGPPRSIRGRHPSLPFPPDRAGAKHLRELLQEGRVPESWIPPTHILELRSLVRLRRTLVEQRTAWQQRIHAQLYHHGHPARRGLLVRERRAWLQGLELAPAARTQIGIALQIIDHVNAQLGPLDGGAGGLTCARFGVVGARWKRSGGTGPG